MTNPVRRIHDAHFKTKRGRPAVVLEALKGQKTLAQLSSEFGIHAQMITDWKRQALDGIPSLFETTPSKPTLSVEQREQIEAPLFQQIGQLKAAAARSKTTTSKKNYGRVDYRSAFADRSKQDYLIGESAMPSTRAGSV